MLTLVRPRKSETPQTMRRGDVGEHRLHDSYPSRVAVAAHITVDLLAHALGEARRSVVSTAEEEHDLTCFTLVRVSHAPLAQCAALAVALGAAELHADIAANLHISTVAVEPLARRADTEAMLRIEREVLWRE